MKSILIKLLAVTGSSSLVAFTPLVKNEIANDSSSYCMVTLKAGEAQDKELRHFKDETSPNFTSQREFRVSKGWTWKKTKEIYKEKICEAENLETVTVEGEGQLTYTFGFWSSDGGITEIKDDFEFNVDNITLTPKWYLGSLGRTKFKEDPLESISTIAFKGYNDKFGLEALKEYYSFTSFVGETKNVVYNGESKEVRIVAENHDILSKNSSYLSCLTFEFTDILTDGLSFDYESLEEKNHTYSNSAIKKYIDSVIYSKLSDDLKKSIVKVSKKETNQVLKQADVTTNTFDAKLYLPSNSEVANTSDLDGEYYYSQLDRENSQFDYYLKNVSDPSKRKKNNNYMLRSVLSNYQEQSYFTNRHPLSIGTTGAIDRTLSFVKPCGIAPVFSVGIDKNNVNKINFDSNKFKYHGEQTYSNYAYSSNSRNFEAIVSSDTEYDVSAITNKLKITVGSSILTEGISIAKLSSSSSLAPFKYSITIANQQLKSNVGDITISLNMGE